MKMISSHNQYGILKGRNMRNIWKLKHTSDQNNRNIYVYILEVLEVAIIIKT